MAWHDRNKLALFDCRCWLAPCKVFLMDDDLRTWWQPDSGDKAPMLTSALVPNSTVNAIRLVWRDIGINTRQGITPGAFRYKVELQTAPNT